MRPNRCFRSCRKGFVALCANALLGSALAQTPPSALQPGMYYIWQTPAQNSPKGKPRMGICAEAPAALADPVLLIGQTPGDAACRATAVRPRTDQAIEFDVMCNGQEIAATAVSRVSGDRFVTLVTPRAGERARPYFVHGENVGGCK
jgi:hypothetical protein